MSLCEKWSRNDGTVLHSAVQDVQNVLLSCRPSRTARSVIPLAERERYTGTVIRTVQNEGGRCPKCVPRECGREKLATCRSCPCCPYSPYSPLLSVVRLPGEDGTDGKSKTVCSETVQNEGGRCPKWRNRVLKF